MKVKNLLAILLALTFLVIPVSAEENDDLIQYGRTSHPGICMTRHSLQKLIS